MYLYNYNIISASFGESYIYTIFFFFILTMSSTEAHEYLISQAKHDRHFGNVSLSLSHSWERERDITPSLWDSLPVVLYSPKNMSGWGLWDTSGNIEGELESKQV